MNLRIRTFDLRRKSFETNTLSLFKYNHLSKSVKALFVLVGNSPRGC